MFNYYGSKSKITDLYPPPEFDEIIEPFAGSARYACHYHTHDVLLVEINPIIAQIWRFLINDATPEGIIGLPDPSEGDRISSYTQLSQVERDLMGFCAGGSGVSRPYDKVTSRPIKNSQWYCAKKRIAKMVPRVRHWRIVETSYENVRINPEATWFVDPPYAGPAGTGYKYSSIDYKRLAEWCLARRGQLIVCEGVGADWLPFEPLPGKHHQCRGTTREAVYLGGVRA